jgi:Spy/CpxP family protein refolding chaperone
MRAIHIATGTAAALLVTALVIAGTARSQTAPAAPDDQSEEMMALGDQGMDAAPMDAPGPAAAPRAWGRGAGGGMHGAPGAPGGGCGFGMRSGRGYGMHRGAGGPDGFGMMMGPAGRLLHASPRIAEELKLTDDQKAKLHDIGEGLARKGIQARADMELAHLDMAKLLRADSPDRDAIAAKIDEISRLRATHMKQALDAGIEARKVLTADQLKKLKELRPGPGRGEGRGMMQGRGHGQGRSQGQGRSRDQKQGADRGLNRAPYLGQ